MNNESESVGLRFPETEAKGTVRYFLIPLVEFLGILVPGAIFLLACMLALVLPLATVVDFLEGTPSRTTQQLYEFSKVLISPSFGTLIIIAIVSYVVGHLFFRQDPKHPDTCSFTRVKEQIGEEGPVRLCEDEKAFNRLNGLQNDHNLEFPYRYLHEYLTDRGMLHLAELIPWRGSDPTTYHLRTKHFLNILKIRLEFVFPNQYLRIQRNEAHVRLMSSMWYSAHALQFVAGCGACIGFLVFGASVNGKDSFYPSPYFGAWLIPCFIIITASVLKRNIEAFLHYQRIREIVFILEAAYFAKSLYPTFEFTEGENR